METPFLLNNEQRKYLGLQPVQDSWELVFLNDSYLYFDKDTIVKQIKVDKDYYFEKELQEHTSHNRSILLPKTAKGKPKKLNYTAMNSFSDKGVYFKFSSSYLCIANYSTQTTFYSESFEDKDIVFLQKWLDTWIKDTTKEELEQITAFSMATRKRYKYKEGDFFSFKIERRKWGFGRILLDVARLKKDPEFKKAKNYGLTNIMSTALIVKVYHKISDTPMVDLKELASCQALPSQSILDNVFFYGQNPIIGNLPLEPGELDMLISYGRSINSKDSDCVYLQYGLIFKQTTVDKLDKYLCNVDDNGMDNPYTNIWVGFGLDTDYLQKAIDANSNDPYWNDMNNWQGEFDLRNPNNMAIKQEVFSFFGLDASKSYEQNIALAQLR
ncbi:immunity 26/phosphotriesterase HocA family protein [Myroides sp. LJL115]